MSATMSSSFASNFTNGVFNGGTVATFTDRGTAMDAKDYAATINWGDGTITAGEIQYSGGQQFTVSDNTDHAYQNLDNYRVTVTVSKDDGASAVTAEDVTEPGYGCAPTKRRPAYGRDKLRTGRKYPVLQQNGGHLHIRPLLQRAPYR